jgi:large subunit ribosomal protein L30
LTENQTQRKCVAAIRIRGVISASLDARETLKMLRLTKNNYAVLIDDRQSYLGMLSLVRDYVTYGEPSKEMVTELIKQRGRLLGNKKLTEDYAQKNGYDSLEALASAVFECKVEYQKLPRIQPVFRLHPPTKGFKHNIKRGYGSGGELGYRAEKIDELLKRMF